MKRKGNTLMLLMMLISGIFTSCFDNFEDREYFSANVTSFGFDEHDTCPDIEDYVFNINQFEGVAADSTDGTIFNLDSLPYGSDVRSLYPTLSFQSTNGNIYMNDSLWEEKDSLDFSKHVILQNTSYDGLYTRRYSIVVNVHQVDPDSMVMQSSGTLLPDSVPGTHCLVTSDGAFNFFFPGNAGGMTYSRSTDKGYTWNTAATDAAGVLNLTSLCHFDGKYYVLDTLGKLQRSSNGTNWSVVSPVDASSNAVKLLALYGEIGRKYLSDPDSISLIGLVSGGSGQILAARSKDGIVWETGNAVPADFPTSQYALIRTKTATGVSYFTLMGGLNAQGKISSGVWSTENGKTWVTFNDGKNVFAPVKRLNGSLFEYDGYLVYFGGIDAEGTYQKDMRISRDHGKTWEEMPENWDFESLPSGLSGATVYVEHQADPNYDKDREYIWILGGDFADGANTEIWKAYLNKMSFDRR